MFCRSDGLLLHTSLHWHDLQGNGTRFGWISRQDHGVAELLPDYFDSNSLLSKKSSIFAPAKVNPARNLASDIPVTVCHKGF